MSNLTIVLTILSILYLLVILFIGGYLMYFLIKQRNLHKESRGIIKQNDKQ